MADVVTVTDPGGQTHTFLHDDAQTGHTSLFNFRNSTQFQDDFITGTSTSGSVGSLGWNSAGTISSVASEANHPGIIRIDTGASSGTTGRLNCYGNEIFEGKQEHNVLFDVRVNTNDANTTIRIGNASTWVGVPTNGIYFEKLDADVNWFAVARVSNGQARVNTGIALDGAFHVFSYVRDINGVTFRIDEVSVAAITTNIPTTQKIGVGINILNSTAASKSLDVDYIEMSLLNLVR